MPIHIELVTQEKKVFDEPEADIVIVPAIEGEMGVLPNHAPVLTTLTFGELVVRKGAAEERFAVYGGVVDVRPDKVVVLADLADPHLPSTWRGRRKRGNAPELCLKAVCPGKRIGTPCRPCGAPTWRCALARKSVAAAADCASWTKRATRPDTKLPN